MTTQDTASGPELEELWILKKHYDARLPEDVRLVPLPKTLYRQSIQTWLVDNLITSEEAFSDEYVNKEGVTGSLGASLWRKAFWKRIVNQIETEIAASADEDVRTLLRGSLTYIRTLANPSNRTRSMKLYCSA